MRFLAAFCLVAVLPVEADAFQNQEDFLSLEGVDLETITLLVQKKTGATFLWTPDLGLDKKKVHYRSSKPVEKKEDVFRLYQSLLQVNDLFLVPVQVGGDKETLYKIQLLVTSSRRPTPVVREIGQPEDRFLMKIFKLSHVSASQVHQALINMVSFPQGVLPIESAGILLVTDYDYNLKRFEQIIKEMDQPRSEMVFEVIPLKNREAANLEVVVKVAAYSLLSRKGATRTVPGLASEESPQANVIADKETNSLILVTDGASIEILKTLVAKLDIPPRK